MFPMRLYSFELLGYFRLFAVQERFTFYTQHTQKVKTIEIQTFHTIPPTFTTKITFGNFKFEVTTTSRPGRHDPHGASLNL